MTYIGMQRYEIIQQERNSADTNYITFYSLPSSHQDGLFSLSRRDSR